MFNEKTKKRKAVEIVGIVVIVILILAIVATFVLCSMFKDSNTAPTLFGKRVYIMNGDGMNPRIEKGAAVFVDEGVLPEAPGNVILCNIDGRLAVLGYVATQNTTMADGSVETKYIVKYDNAPADQQWAVSSSDIIGRAVSYDTFLGAVIRFASSKAGMLVVVIVPCALLVIYEVIMLILAAKRNKRPEIEPEELVFGDAEAFQLYDKDKNNRRKEVVDIKFEPDKALEASFKGEFNGNYEFKSLQNSELKKAEDVLYTSPAKNNGSWQTEEAITSTDSKANSAYEAPVFDTSAYEKPSEEQAINSETETKLDETEKAETSSEPAVSMSTRIDELIRLLEEEKARLNGK